VTPRQKQLVCALQKQACGCAEDAQWLAESGSWATTSLQRNAAMRYRAIRELLGVEPYEMGYNPWREDFERFGEERYARVWGGAS